MEELGKYTDYQLFDELVGRGNALCVFTEKDVRDLLGPEATDANVESVRNEAFGCLEGVMCAAGWEVLSECAAELGLIPVW